VPQLPQNVRTTGGDDWKRFGSPDTNANWLAGKTAQATDGAPLAKRQLWQWQSARASD